MLPGDIFKVKEKVPIYFVNHHLAHAASVFYASKMQQAAILVLDGQGEDKATSLYFGSDKKLDLKKDYPINQSLGFLYSAFSVFCGLGVFGAGKLMGLSAYGNPRYVKEVREVFDGINIIDRNPDAQDEFILKTTDLLEKRGFKKVEQIISFNTQRSTILKNPSIKKVHMDLAASVQKFLEEKILDYAKEIKYITKSDNLCLAGGVALNCLANSNIEIKKIFKNIFIQPVCEDSGSALGAAFYVSKKRPTEPFSPYQGPNYNSKEITKLLKTLKISYSKEKDVELTTAKMIAEGKIVGWFQGRMECGPRALGNRSILADPRNEKMKGRLNNTKGRELWRPFGLSILEEEAQEILESFSLSPFMLKSFIVKRGWRKKVKAAIHTDFSTRPQTVSKIQNPNLYKLLMEYYKLTGVPALINTSFNYNKEPIVCSPIDALKTFYSSGLDCLVMENIIVRK
ncbi:MAG: carbamoyltransferase C-terminal domain-containing protein [Patescibacteria group bacterium]